MLAKKQKSSPASRDREDGRRQILLYLKTDVILELKTEALRRDTTAYELAEEAIETFLAKRKKPRI
jgi:hypothetical protein